MGLALPVCCFSLQLPIIAGLILCLQNRSPSLGATVSVSDRFVVFSVSPWFPVSLLALSWFTELFCTKLFSRFLYYRFWRGCDLSLAFTPPYFPFQYSIINCSHMLYITTLELIHLHNWNIVHLIHISLFPWLLSPWQLLSYSLLLWALIFRFHI